MRGLFITSRRDLSRCEASWAIFSIRSAVIGLGLCAAILTPFTPAAAQSREMPNTGAHSSSHVYFLTGLLGIRSGLDGLATKVRQRGLPSTMSSPGGWSGLAQSAISEFRGGRLRSIVIVGYSTGAGSALQMASQLHGAKVPVNLVITIDGVSGPPVPPNVRKLINLYVRGGFGDAIARPAGFSGVLQNIQVEGPNVGHFSIIDAKETQLLTYVLAAAGTGSSSVRKSEQAPDAGASASEGGRAAH